MKKANTVLFTLLAIVIMLSTACSNSSKSAAPAPAQATEQSGSAGEASAEEQSAPTQENVKIDKLRIAYVPSTDAQVLLAAVEPLKQMLADELATHGFDVKEIEITVGTSFEAVGESLASGSVDIGIGGASVYVTYDDEVDLILTATRNDFNKEGNDPKVWNDGISERVDGKLTTGYRGLIYAGPSAYGQQLATKVENGEELSWEDLDQATWAVGNTTSNAGYLYPCLWLKNNYGKMFSDLSNVIPGTNYPTMVTQAASEQIDIFMVFADGRIDYEEAWTTELGRSESMWDEVKVIGVTDMIMNDVIMGSQISDAMTLPGFKDAFGQSMIDIAATDAGREAISILSHNGYVIGNDSDYDSVRKVQEIIKTLD